LIPFTITPAGQEDPKSLEAVLFVSGDRGQTWHNYQTQPITSGKFSFRAGADGEFWFAVRTKIGRHPLEIPGDLAAELRVRVDRQRPVLELSVQSDPPTAMRIEWKSVDSDLLPGSFRAEFREGTMGNWQAIPLALAQSTPASGMTRWVPPNPSASYWVRITASDRAGNVAVAERDLATLASSGSRQPYYRLDPQAAPGGMVPPFAATERPAVVESRPTDSPAPASQPFPLETSTPPPPPASPSTTNEAPWTQAPMSDSDPGVSGQTRTSRSRKFQLEYVIENDAAGGVHRVEVWYTSDSGQSWMHYGDDEDRQSPMVAEVPDDGLYGYRLLIQAREGLVAQPPRSGDPADVWVR
ncbi:MAG TPA: hypothetical protein VIY86_01460, partial [Pirellulaceae bacterium]